MITEILTHIRSVLGLTIDLTTFLLFASVKELITHFDAKMGVDEGYSSEISTPGGSHIIISRKDIRPTQTRLLLEKGYLPISLNHRLCPGVKLAEGGMVDICDTLDWARNTLPNLKLQSPGLLADGERVVAVGWSSGGQLAMSLAWTAPQRGLRPPEAFLAFYCPTDYEDERKLFPIARTQEP
jgi:acetyl esterase/lipase